jgi:lipid A 3-O-deacylase
MPRVRDAAAAALMLAFGVALARPVMAQITLGSPNDPARIALGVGAFDIFPSAHKDSITAGELRGEYRFGDVLWFFAPFVGASVTTRGATYEYFGFGFDINFGPSWVLTPNGAAGVFTHGSGTDLGSWWEFRTGAELDYRFANQDRLGVAFQHMSNAGLTKQNPGEESLTLVFTMPVPW